MKAATIMLVAIGALALGHWAHGEVTVPSLRGLAEIVFALLFISFLDQGQTEPIAKGLALLFLAAVLLGDKSILTSISKISTGPVTTAKPATKKAA